MLEPKVLLVKQLTHFMTGQSLNTTIQETYPGDRIRNIDGTGLSVVQTKILHVIASKGKQPICSLIAAEHRTLWGPY